MNPMRKDAKEYDWLEDPFNEDKQAEDMLRAQRTRNLGCIAVALVVIVLFFALIIGGFVLFGAVGAGL